VNRDRLNELLSRLERGEISRDDCLEELARLPFRNIGPARLDTHRELRQGIPEVVMGRGKTPAQILEIVRALRDEGDNVLVTRVEPDVGARLVAEIPGLTHHADAGLLVLRQAPIVERGKGSVLIVTAGTADQRIAEECAITAELFGNKVERLFDVGVAGLHRLLAAIDVLRSAHVVVAIAGMEGALPSVLAGLIERPVIAVPTSVGYGASLGGVAALLSMLNACAPNVAVVNIDNGFGAAYLATLINRG
jgi:pyridinium-3,5-biscarboxylic acid mononucleotide synthase